MDINAWSERLSDAFDYSARNHSKEMELREHVHQTIVDAIRDLYGLTFSATSGETNTKKTGGGHSPADRLYGGVVVEWEWNMSGLAAREHGADQALTYLTNLREKHGAGDAFTAVVTDGKQWGFLRYDPKADDDLDLFAAPAPTTQALHFRWVPNSAGACRQFLELIGAHRKTPITSSNLTQRFGPSSEIAHQLVSILSQTAVARLPEDRTDTLFTEWRRALEVVYGNLDDTTGDLAEAVQKTYRVAVARPLGEMLFVLHTYFALVGRVLAVELLALAANEPDDAPSNWQSLPDDQLLARLKGLERGVLPGSLTISNLFESDLFSWWADQAGNNTTLKQALRDLLKEVSELAFPQIAFGPRTGGDVLRDLYQSLIPRQLRKALGEFLTPHWLAAACLARLREQGANLHAGRVLDPTCGTGTFIVPVLAERLSRLQQDKGTEVTVVDVQHVLDSVAGIDLNPVAITASRVNYVLALGDLASIGDLTLPVWRADSLIVPEPDPVQGTTGDIAGIVHAQLETSLTEPFTIPASMNTATRIAELRAAIDDAMVLVENGKATQEDVDWAREDFKAGFKVQFGPTGHDPLAGFVFDDELAVAVHLFNQVADLAVKGRNSVWARLIENAYAPLFAGQFDVVVGNPPWLTWTKLPAGWRAKSKPLWRKTGLWYTPVEHGDSFSLQTGDIATLVFAVSLLRYAKPDAFVGLLVPNALINADPGSRAFRQFRLKPDKRDASTYKGVNIPFKAVFCDDWSKVKPFAPDAANQPIFLVTKRGETQGGQTPGALWTRSAQGAKLVKESWRDTRKVLHEATGSFAPVDPNTPTSAWRFQDHSKPLLLVGGQTAYRFGKGLDTRGANGIYFVSIDRFTPAVGSAKALIRIKNNKAEGRTKNVTEHTGDVEADLVYPLLRGKDVTHWVAKAHAHFLLPHDPVDVDRVLEGSVLRREYPKAHSWLRHNKTVLENRKAPPTRSWNMSATGNDWCRVDGALKHQQSGFSVVVRELSERPAAALVEPVYDMRLQRSVTPLIDHKLMLCTVPSRDEALYLTAMVNSTPMQDLLASFINSTAVSPKSMSRLPIPDFDPCNADMAALVALAETVTTAVDPTEEATRLQDDMDALVLRIVAAAPDYAPQPKKALKQARIRPASAADEALFEV